MYVNYFQVGWKVGFSGATRAKRSVWGGIWYAMSRRIANSDLSFALFVVKRSSERTTCHLIGKGVLQDLGTRLNINMKHRIELQLYWGWLCSDFNVGLLNIRETKCDVHFYAVFYFGVSLFIKGKKNNIVLI